MFEVGVVTHFEAAHRLRGDFGPAIRTHGHTYRVEVGVQGAALRDDGTLCDISVLQQAVQDVTGGLHYRDLDELGVFEGHNSTAEVVARYLFAQVAAKMANRGLAALIVRVWESPHAYASYEGDLS